MKNVVFMKMRVFLFDVTNRATYQYPYNNINHEKEIRQASYPPRYLRKMQ